MAFTSNLHRTYVRGLYPKKSGGGIGLDECKITFCQKLCEHLCDQLTVIKGYIELNEDKGKMQFSTEIKREIDEMITSIRASIDEINGWNN